MRLDVYGQMEGRFELVGALETRGERQEEFSYSEPFLERHPGAALSRSLPPRKGPFPYRQTRPYFQGPLPEGPAMEAVARRLEVDTSSYLKVIKAIGRECIGAVAIVDSGETVAGVQRLRRVSEESLMGGLPNALASLQPVE